MGSRPNFRDASALLRGSSRTYGPKRGIRRDAPSVCLAGRGRRPLPAGPTPTSSANLLFSQFKVLLNFFQKIAGSRGRAPAAARTRRNALSCEALFSGELPRSGERGLFAREKAPFQTYGTVSNRKGPGRIFPPKAPPEAPAPRETPLRSGFPFG